jgi:hypothetical protein
MKDFDIKRFCKTFRWVFSVNFRELAIWSLGLGVGLFVMMIIVGWLDGAVDHATICTMAVLIAYLGCLGNIFLPYNRRKGRREALLMLPATNLEKYLAVVLFVTVVGAVTLFLGFALGDTLRMVVRSVFYGDEWFTLIPKVWNNLTPSIYPANGHYDVVEPMSYLLIHFISVVGSFVWVHSLYMLGGTLLRKYAFVFTSLFGIALIMLLTWLFREMYISTSCVELIDNHYVRVVGMGDYIICVLECVLIVFNYWASFRIFKGFQLITNKWMNYDLLKR